MESNWKSLIAILIIAIVIIPVSLNYLCLTIFPIPIVGDGKVWLGFWGAYLGGIITVLSSVFLFFKNIEKEGRQKVYESQNQYFNELCVDMGKLCSAIDVDILCFYLAKMKSGDKMLEIMSNLGALDKSIKTTYNEFCLKYSHYKGQEGDALIDAYRSYANSVRDSISVIMNAVEMLDNHKISKDVYSSLIANECEKLKSLGDVTSHLFLLAESWKKSECEYRDILQRKVTYKS